MHYDKLQDIIFDAIREYMEQDGQIPDELDIGDMIEDKVLFEFGGTEDDRSYQFQSHLDEIIQEELEGKRFDRFMEEWERAAAEAEYQKRHPYKSRGVSKGMFM